MKLFSSNSIFSGETENKEFKQAPYSFKNFKKILEESKKGELDSGLIRLFSNTSQYLKEYTSLKNINIKQVLKKCKDETLELKRYNIYDIQYLNNVNGFLEPMLGSGKKSIKFDDEETKEIKETSGFVSYFNKYEKYKTNIANMLDSITETHIKDTPIENKLNSFNAIAELLEDILIFEDTILSIVLNKLNPEYITENFLLDNILEYHEVLDEISDIKGHFMESLIVTEGGTLENIQNIQNGVLAEKAENKRTALEMMNSVLIETIHETNAYLEDINIHEPEYNNLDGNVINELKENGLNRFISSCNNYSLQDMENITRDVIEEAVILSEGIRTEAGEITPQLIPDEVSSKIVQENELLDRQIYSTVLDRYITESELDTIMNNKISKDIRNFEIENKSKKNVTTNVLENMLSKSSVPYVKGSYTSLNFSDIKELKESLNGNLPKEVIELLSENLLQVNETRIGKDAIAEFNILHEEFDKSTLTPIAINEKFAYFYSLEESMVIKRSLGDLNKDLSKFKDIDTFLSILSKGVI